MFDNNFNATGNFFIGNGPSRLLIVTLDEDRLEARLTWELVLEDQSCIFGDNDQLPTGNLIASSWPIVIREDAPFQYDARAFEVQRDTKATAWELFVIGERCVAPGGGGDGCVRSDQGGIGTGWTMYSVERFYTAPLVYDLGCAVDADAPGAGTGAVRFTFTSHNNFKMNDAHAGSYRLFQNHTNGETGTDIASGNFTFVAFWKPTVVAFSVSGIALDADFDGMLAVFNEWGDRTAKHVSCKF